MVEKVKLITLPCVDKHTGEEYRVKIGIGIWMADGSRYCKAFTKKKLGKTGKLSIKVIDAAGGWSVKREGEINGVSIANSDHHLKRVMSTRLVNILISEVWGYVNKE